MDLVRLVRRLWWQKKEVTWTMRLARFLGRSRKLALFAGIVALLGGARELRRRSATS